MAELPRTLSVWRGTALMLNIVLGAGLLTLPGLAVGAVGSAAPLVWLACALAALPLIAVFAILGRRFPSSGGIAGMLVHGFGDFGYVAATLLFLGAVVFGLPAIALAGGHYAAALFGGVPHAWALGLIAAAALANAVSSEAAGRFNAALASVLLVLIVGLIVVGWRTVGPELSDLAISRHDLPPAPALATSFMMVFFAFTGWELGANLGGEFRNPARDFPLAMGLSFAIVVALYGGLAVVVQAADLAGQTATPFAVIFERAFGTAGLTVIGIVAVVLILANLSAAIWAVSRMIHSAASERLLPSALAQLRGQVPVAAVVTTVGAIMLMTVLGWAGFMHLGALLAVAGQNFLLLYGAAAAVLIRTSPAAWQRRLGWLCIAVVGSIAAIRGLEGAFYPAVLVTAAALIAYTPARQRFRRQEEETFV